MTAAELARLFTTCAVDAQFETWAKERKPHFHTVYLCDYGTIWKYSLKEWWQLASRAVRNNGNYELTECSALRIRPKHILVDHRGEIYCRDLTIRCVSPRNWTLDEWKAELV